MLTIMHVSRHFTDGSVRLLQTAPSYTSAGASYFLFRYCDINMRQESTLPDLYPAGRVGDLIMTHGMFYAMADKISSFAPPFREL